LFFYEIKENVMKNIVIVGESGAKWGIVGNTVRVV
jgi:hypothetical protein